MINSYKKNYNFYIAITTKQILYLVLKSMINEIFILLELELEICKNCLFYIFIY